MTIYNQETCPDGYVPFTYLIRFKYTGRVYYGSKYAVKGVAHPSMMWTTYFTSSSIIKQLVDEFGPLAFDFEVRQIFDTAEAAHNWERRVLTRFDAKRDKRFFNCTNGTQKAYLVGPKSEQHQLNSMGKRGPLPPEVKQRRYQSMKERGVQIGGTYGQKAPRSEEAKKHTKKLMIQRGTLKTGPMTNEERQRRKEVMSARGTTRGKPKSFRLCSPDGVVYEGVCLRRFCEENDLVFSSMAQVCSGRLTQCKKWTGCYTKTD